MLGTVVAEYPPQVGAEGAIVELAGVPVEDEILRTKQPIQITNVLESESLGPVRRTLLDLGVSSILIVPIVAKNGDVLGSFSLDSIKTERVFSEQEVEFCTVFAAQVGVSIENARLYEHSKGNERRLELLLRANAVLANSDTSAEGLHELARLFVTAVQGSFCRILLIAETGSDLTLRAACGPNATPTFQSGKIGEIVSFSSLPPNSLTSAGHIAIDSEQNESWLKDRSSELGIDGSIDAELFIPLRHGDVTVGVVEVGHISDGRSFNFAKNDIELGTSIAQQSTGQIDRIRLFEWTQRRRDLLVRLDDASNHLASLHDPLQLPREAVRLAVEVLLYTAGAFYVSHPHLGVLDCVARYGDPNFSLPEQLGTSDELVGLAARTGRSQFQTRYGDFGSAAAVPLKWGGDVIGVLCVGDAGLFRSELELDLEVLERFAARTSLELKIGEALSGTPGLLRPVEVFHALGKYFATARDLDRIAHAILTGITASYGLRFNRAALLLLDPARQLLTAHTAIGHLQNAEAHRDWEHDKEHHRDDLTAYLRRLNSGDLASTPLKERLSGIVLPISDAGCLADILRSGSLQVPTLALVPCHHNS